MNRDSAPSWRLLPTMRLAVGLLALLLLVPAPASAARPKPLRDCQRHDGIVAGSYTARELTEAYDAIRPARRVASNCGQSIASHLAALDGPRGGRDARDVLDDCTRHGGRLTRRFAPHALLRAARIMTDARREQTRCRVGIFSQLRARKRAVAIQPARRSRVRGPYDDQTGVELRDSLKPFTEALRRGPLNSDLPPENLFDFVTERNDRRDAGFDIFSFRRVGPDETPVWLVTADGRMCGLRWYGPTVQPGITCKSANRWAKGTAALRVRAHDDGTNDIWGVAPDAMEDGTLLFGASERSRELVAEGNGVLDELSELPGAVEYDSLDGGQQWFDATRKPCSEGCVSVPDVEDF